MTGMSVSSLFSVRLEFPTLNNWCDRFFDGDKPFCLAANDVDFQLPRSARGNGAISCSEQDLLPRRDLPVVAIDSHGAAAHAVTSKIATVVQFI